MTEDNRVAVFFNNVSISMMAKDGTEAYAKLCKALATLDDDSVEWTTDTYSVYENEGDGRCIIEEADTEELFDIEESDPCGCGGADSCCGHPEA